MPVVFAKPHASRSRRIAKVILISTGRKNLKPVYVKLTRIFVSLLPLNKSIEITDFKMI
jgi:hypothetical protein